MREGIRLLFYVLFKIIIALFKILITFALCLILKTHIYEEEIKWAN